MVLLGVDVLHCDPAHVSIILFNNFVLFSVEDIHFYDDVSWSEFQCGDDLSGLFEATWEASGPTVTFLVLSGLDCIQQIFQQVLSYCEIVGGACVVNKYGITILF